MTTPNGRKLEASDNPLADLDMTEDSPDKATAVPDSPALKNVSDLVAEWDKIVAYLNKGAELMATASARKAEIEQVAVPAAMAEAGVTSFVTTSGRKVVMDTVARGNIPAQSTIDKAKGDLRLALEKRRDQALAIVRERWPGLIKTEVSVSLGRGEAGVASSIAELIRNQFQLTPSVDETIHAQTLNAHFNELRESGKLADVPAEPFALYIGPIAKIK